MKDEKALFYARAPVRQVQRSMIASPRANCDLCPLKEPNQTLDGGFPRSAGGIDSAVAHCEARGINFELEPLESEPFYHGYSKKCSDEQITVGIWRMQITDLKGNLVYVLFYITRGDGFLLLGNEILRTSASDFNWTPASISENNWTPAFQFCGRRFLIFLDAGVHVNGAPASKLCGRRCPDNTFWGVWVEGSCALPMVLFVSKWRRWGSLFRGSWASSSFSLAMPSSTTTSRGDTRTGTAGRRSAVTVTPSLLSGHRAGSADVVSKLESTTSTISNLGTNPL